MWYVRMHEGRAGGVWVWGGGAEGGGVGEFGGCMSMCTYGATICIMSSPLPCRKQQHACMLSSSWVQMLLHLHGIRMPCSPIHRMAGIASKLQMQRPHWCSCEPTGSARLVQHNIEKRKRPCFSALNEEKHKDEIHRASLYNRKQR